MRSGQWWYWKVEMETRCNWKLEVGKEMEMEMINKRDGRTGKDGKVNKRSKWKNGK